jgi:hypothetical protein
MYRLKPEVYKTLKHARDAIITDVYTDLMRNRDTGEDRNRDVWEYAAHKRTALAAAKKDSASGGSYVRVSTTVNMLAFASAVTITLAALGTSR